MPKLIPQKELDTVQEAVACFPEGASVEEVCGALTIKIPRSTLQRRMALLANRRLVVEGRGRGSLYMLIGTIKNRMAVIRWWAHKVNTLRAGLSKMHVLRHEREAVTCVYLER